MLLYFPIIIKKSILINYILKPLFLVSLSPPAVSLVPCIRTTASRNETLTRGRVDCFLFLIHYKKIF
jgi:hypothetical protein